MQHLILALALLFSSLLFGQSPDNLENTTENSVTVTVVNVLSDTGEVKFAFYTEENFRKVPLYANSATIKNGKSTVVFENVPAGEYAVLCFHDENENNRMDFYENGMPKESYGTSNNIMTFGPPEFENSKFVVSENDLTLEIKF